MAAVSLAALTLILYWQVQRYEFLVWDDYEYVVENPHVRSGFSIENVIWAFTSGYASNWHPLTWLSHMLDCTLYGLNPAGHHLNSALLHVANTLLLFFLFVRITRGAWESAFIAVIFALHPLHVESVAWVSERKDVLSTLFLLLSLFAYVRYTRRPRTRTYVMLMALYALGLASKPMLVTLPLVLLLLDHWPLRRTAPFFSGEFTPSGTIKFTALVKEKLPLFALAGLSSLITFLVSKADQSTASLNALPVGLRLGNALVSYVSYIIKTFWPMDLAFFYPHPLGALSTRKVVASSIFLACISLVAFVMRRKRPYLFIGWLWYVITLLPVIGLVQVGSQAMADRYTYVPLIGISIMVAWEASHFLGRSAFRTAALGLSLAVILSLCLVTSSELGHWRNGETLFRHALKVTAGNYTAHFQLGNELMKQGRMESAIHHFSEAVRIRPDHFPAHQNLGSALAAQGRFDEAVEHYMAALRLRPRHAGILSSMGDAFLSQGKLEQAIIFYCQALGIDPFLWVVHNNAGVAYLKKGMPREAIKHFEEALRLNPGDRKASHNLQIARKNMEEQSD